jgi:hypothetical protein
MSLVLTTIKPSHVSACCLSTCNRLRTSRNAGSRTRSGLAALKKYHRHVSCLLRLASVSNAAQAKEERRMNRSRASSWAVGILVGLGVSLALCVMPAPADAGGVRLSIGIGIPAPVYVAPPPIVVHPAPVIVQPAPGIVYPGVVYPPPGAYAVPYGAYGHPVPPVIVKKHHGYHPVYGYKFYKHGRRGW